MLNAFESFLIIAASILAALACLFAYRRYWLARGRHHQNDIIGWQITFLATTYAVIIAFMLSDVWNNYRAAEKNTESEANALTNLYRTAAGLPSPQREQLRSLAQRYAEAMISEEWPAMMEGSFSKTGFAVIADLWTAITSTHAHDESEQAILTRALNDLTDMTEHRRIRHLANRVTLPNVFWVLLIIGGILTVFYTCLFEIEQTALHVSQVVATTFIVSLVLVTIADVDSPYGGALHIQPTGFALALQTMK
jgi:uncharacterized tellurite resistance protein B-like protein